MKNRILKVALAAAVSIIICACDSENDPEFDGFTKVSGNIETIAGLGPDNFGYDGDGRLSTEAKVGWITGITVDAAGNIFVTDGAANTLRKISYSSGIISTEAGGFRGFNTIDATPYAGDGGPATDAHLNVPIAATTDLSGNIYITDTGNNAIRKILNGEISTSAGTGIPGYEGDGGLANLAKVYNPSGIAVDADGNIYIADGQNNVIRKVAKSSGVITTIAGLGPNNAGYTGDDGPAVSAKLNSPQGIAVDSNGNIYISDSGNNVLRKISNGTITTIAGTGAEGYSGDGSLATAATFRAMKGVAVDINGNIFIADASNNAVRKISSSGIITTYAGNGTEGYSGDGGPANLAQLSNPWGVAVDSKGNLYIADSNNSAVRFVAK